MAGLVWKPQPAYTDFFYTDSKTILEKRSVFREDLVYFVPYGGRGSAKTWTFADAVVVEATLRPVRVLVTRELQNSIEESIKAEIEAAIINRGVEHFFQVLKTEINGRNGSHFLFKGLKNNIRNIKSIANVDIVLCEEAENVSPDSWTKLLPSIRPKQKEYRNGEPIVIVIFNPDDELDETYQRFVENPPSVCLSKLINWRDNKYFTANLERQRQDCLRLRPKKEYLNVWEGQPKGAGPDVIIELEWIKAAKFASRHPEWPLVDDPLKRVGYDPAGQGRDSHAVTIKDGNIINYIDEWLISDDLREATKRALGAAFKGNADVFSFDECGGFGDGVSVFISDEIIKYKAEYAEEHNKQPKKLEIHPFDAGSAVVDPDEEIPGTSKTWGEQYSNAKAQSHAITAQLLYNTFRFIILGERDMFADDLLSLDIDDEEEFRKLARELKTPIWVKSNTNSKRKVESKKDMEKRTGLPSPNKADSVHMTSSRREAALIPMLW